MVVHEKIKSFFCDVCGLAFGQKTHLNNHVEAKHLKRKNYFCDKCDYAATRKEAYVKHVKVVHDRIKDFICSLCPSAFGQKAHLKAHVDNVHIKYNEDPAKNLTAQGFSTNALCQVAKNRSKLVEAYIML